MIIVKLMKKSQNKKGFTLIELIITIVIVGMIAIPLSLLLAEMVQSVETAGENNIAVNLARLEMEIVNNLDYDSITSRTTTFGEYPYDVIRDVNEIYSSGDEGLKEISVEVQKSGSEDVLVTFITYLAKNVNYGI